MSNMFRGRLPFIFKFLVLVGVVVLLINHFVPSNTSPFNTLSQAISSKSTNLADQEIPKKVWQTWHTSAILLEDEERERARTWQERNPHYQYELLTDHGAESYVLHHFAHDPLIRDTFLNLTDKILRADFMRYIVLAAEGGVYADLDVVCQEPIDTWIPPDFQGKVGVVLGVEQDRLPVTNDADLYYDYRKYIWGINNWTIMCKADHPFMRFVAQSIARNLLDMARKQYRTLATMKLSYKEVIDSTGPRAFTNAFFAYVSRVTGKKFTHKDATMLEEPMLVDDILILPIRAMSTAEAERDDAEGAHSPKWPAVVFHWSVGSWKSTHFQQPEDKAAAEAEGDPAAQDKPPVEGDPVAQDNQAVEGNAAVEEVPAAEAIPAAEMLEETKLVAGEQAVEAAVVPDGAQAGKGDQASEVDTSVKLRPAFKGNPPVEGNPLMGEKPLLDVNPLIGGQSPVEGDPTVLGNSPAGGDPPVVADLPGQ